MARTAEDVDLPLRVGRPRRGDLREQVAEQLRSALRAGAFAPEQRLPSSRALAQHLQVSRATVVAALAELDGEGWVVSRHGSGTYVSDGIELSTPEPPARDVTPAGSRGRGARDPGTPAHRRVDLTPGMPDTTGLVDPSWRRAWREAVSAGPPSGAPDLAGEAVLRAALAAHVRRTRGIPCTAEQVLVTSGTGDAVRLLADATGIAGGVAVVEEPGYPSARDVLRLAGARLHGLPVDDDGAVVDALADAPQDTRMLYLTPSHQYPLGGRLPVQRRLDVLRWAAERDALVVEDDYDGEFRFGALPVPALASLDDGGRVAYVGTLSKAVAPGLRLGFVVVGREMLDAAVTVRRATGIPVSEVVQRAMGAYVGGGALRRHVARKRRLYAERRTRLARRLAALGLPIEVRGLEAGLHAVVTLPPDRATTDLVRALDRRGVVVADLDEYRMLPDPSRPGLVIGYGHASAAELDLAVDALAAALR
ncbi:MAG TPA: PLP-dependent aminotransferase family protein [Jiangellales bacterium]|nr:PLP-dependent aminotransferase family protein [Jiangellales bacterium]